MDNINFFNEECVIKSAVSHKLEDRWFFYSYEWGRDFKSILASSDVGIFSVPLQPGREKKNILRLCSFIVMSMQWNLTRNLIAFGSNQGKIQLRNGDLEFIENRSEEFIENINEISFGENFYVSASERRDVIVRDIETGQKKYHYEHGFSCNTVDVCKQTNLIASGGRDNTVLLCDYRTPKVLTLGASVNEINKVRWDLSGNTLAYCSMSGGLNTVDIRKESLNSLFENKESAHADVRFNNYDSIRFTHYNTISNIAWLDTDYALYSSGEKLLIFSVVNGIPDGKLLLNTKKKCHSILVKHEENTIVLGGTNDIYVIDFETI